MSFPIWNKAISAWQKICRGKSSKPFPRHDYRLVRNLRGHSIPKFRQISHIRKVLTDREYKFWKLSLAVFVVSALWLGAIWITTYRAVVPAKGGTYTEGLVGAPRLVNPLFAPLNEVDMDISRLVFSGLLRYDSEQRLVPDAASSYEVSADKKVYTFHLKTNIKWHDGKPLTAKDAIFTFEAIQDQLVGSPLFVSFQGVKVEAPDDGTVVFTLSEPFPSFISSLTVGIIPSHIWQDIPPDQMKLAGANLRPIGTGPYAFNKLVKDDSGFISNYELIAFADYYRDLPYIEDIIFQFFSGYEGIDGALYALREQKIDGINFVPATWRDDVKRKHINLYTLQLPQYTAIFLNKDNNPALADIETRNALDRAIDHNKLLGAALGGEGSLIHGPILPGFPGFDANIAGLGYSLEDANALLDKKWNRVSAADYENILLKKYLAEQKKNEEAQAKLEIATSTIVAATTTPEDAQKNIEELVAGELNKAQTFYRMNKSGQVLEMNLVTADTPEYNKAANLIAGYWQEAGVKTKVTLVNFKDISRGAIKERDYDALLYGVIIGGDPDQYPFWHSGNVSYPGLNLSRYANSKADELLARIRQTDDEAKINEYYEDLQKMIIDDKPAIFLYTPTYTYALSDKVKGFSVKRITHPSDRFSGVLNMYVKTKGDWKW
ncbi:MAG: ABC transporter substrate-binding protein [Patescibacteria group bacterium]